MEAASPKPTTLADFIGRTIERTLAGCTCCGKCYGVCPMPRYSKQLEGASAPAVVGGILDLLRGAEPSAQAVEWTRICTQSASCIPACPENINPMLMLRIARVIALGSTGAPRRIEPKDDPEFFLKIVAFARLQLTDEELAQWR